MLGSFAQPIRRLPLARCISIRADSKMSTFTKTIVTPGNGPTPQKHQKVTVAADLYLSDGSGGKGTGIWSTHKPSGFLFSATRGPEPFEYEAGVGGVVTGWEDGVASMQVGMESLETTKSWDTRVYGILIKFHPSNLLCVAWGDCGSQPAMAVCM